MALRFEVINELSEAERIWKKLSPEKSLFDDWDFRMGFHKYHQKKLNFIAGYSDTELVGLAPLQFDDKGVLEFFGGSYMEDNRIFVTHETFLSEFYDQIKNSGLPYRLEYISGEDKFTTGLPLQDHKYVLPIDFSTAEEYIDKAFHGETKKKLRKRVAKVEEQKIEMIFDRHSDIEILIDYNLKMFTDSAFVDRPYHKEIFRDFFLPHRSFKPRLLTFVKNGEVLAVTIALIYKDTYVAVNRGFKDKDDSNFREWAHTKKVEDAIKLGMKRFDALAGDYGWKERWGMQKIPQYKFVN